MEANLQNILDKVNSQNEEITRLSRLESLPFDSQAVWTGYGGIVFTDANGQLTNDFSAFSYDRLNSAMYLGPIGSFNGIPKLGLFGNNANYRGPHIEAYTNADAYPLFQQLNWTHDNISFNFDSYFDGTNWRSSDAGSNFQIYKLNDTLKINYATGYAQNSLITWKNGLSLDTAGNWNFYGNMNMGSSTAATDAFIEIGANGSGNRNAYIDFHGDNTYADYGLRIIRGNGGANTDSNIIHRGTGTLALNALDSGGIALQSNTGTKVFVNATGIGFYGTGGVAKQTVTGSRGGNAALASLLTALANIGLITNSTSA